MKKSVNSKVYTPEGKATLCNFYVTELGYMAKIFYPKKNTCINYKIGDIKSLLDANNLKLVSEWTKSMQIENFRKNNWYDLKNI